MDLLQTVSRVTIGSSKGRAHASHLVGSTQRIQGTRGWDYVDHHWQRPTFLCPPFEKHSPAAAMQSASSGRIAIYFDHVVKARRPMSDVLYTATAPSGCLRRLMACMPANVVPKISGVASDLGRFGVPRSLVPRSTTFCLCVVPTINLHAS